MLNLIKKLYFCGIIGAVTLIEFPFFLLGIFIGNIIKSRQLDKYAHQISKYWGRFIFKLMPGWKLEIRGNYLLPKSNDVVVFVANHESNADIWISYCFIDTHFKWLSKNQCLKFQSLVE